jgi:dihydroorotate dehydrogenase (NAD+) catalytic subunit
MEYGFLNALGLPNPSYKYFIDEIHIAKEGKVPVIASVFGQTEEEFLETASSLSEVADAIELNMSCPHVKAVNEIGSNPTLVKKITKSVKRSVDVPVWVKLSPNVRDIVYIGRCAESGGADAIVAINTIRAMAIDIDSGYPILGNRFGGLSGKAIKPIALRCVYDLYANLRIPIIGVGGISSWMDAVEFMMAGARAVQIGSGVYESLKVFENISNGVARYIGEKGIELDELIGIAHER